MEFHKPFFTVIVPTRNRPKQLTQCLETLTQLDYPCNGFEVIIVDDGSKTSPKAIVESFRSKMQVTLIIQAGAGPATARNTGAKYAKGEFLAFTDDDCMPAPDWLKNLAECCIEKPDCALGGQTLNALPDNVYSTASQLLNDYLYSQYNANQQQARFFASNNLAIPADTYNAIGGFDQSYPRAAGEDRDLCERWLSNGYRMIYVPEALVYHAHPLTFFKFWRQQRNYGRGAFLFRHKCRAINALHSNKLEAASFYWRLLQYPFLKKLGFQALPLGTLVLLSQLAITTGYLLEMAAYPEKS